MISGRIGGESGKVRQGDNKKDKVDCCRECNREPTSSRSNCGGGGRGGVVGQSPLSKCLENTSEF